MRLLFILILAFLLGCGPATNKREIKVACAANMQYAMDSIAVIFAKEYGINCDITSASSGILTSQIENGAPYDVFVSANMNYPEAIFKHKKGEKPIVYAKGRLVLVVDKDVNYKSIDEALADKKMVRIGMADKATAPYGMAAYQYLENSGNKKVVESRLIISESIGQVNQYISTNSVNAGFTSYSFKVKNGSQYTYFEVDQDKFDPIYQGAMILNHGLNNDKAACQQLLTFFTSPKCKDILTYFGYLAD